MNASKRKGTQFETDVVRYLRIRGYDSCERRTLSGQFDRGDIAGIPRVVIECKATRELDVAGAVDEAHNECINADAELGLAVIKRRRRGVADAYAVLPLAAMVTLLKKAGY